MNCQQFRQYCTLEPTYREENFLHHQQVCSACAAFAQDMMQFEQTLVAAMKVEIPAGLVGRILAQQTSHHSQMTSLWAQIVSFWSPRRPIYALAASMLLVIGLFASGLWWWQADTMSLPPEVIAYLENEPQAFLTGGEVPADELRGMFQAIGAELTGDIGSVSFCKLLNIKGYASAHIVLTGAKGPVNVLFIRNSQITGPRPVSNGQLKGVILSAAWGNIAIVGMPEEPLDEVAARVNNAVNFSAAG